MERVALTGTQETLLITLYARALESRSARPILADPWAEAAVERVDHDFAKFHVDRQHQLTISLRAKKFDDWTRAFLRDNPCGTVLYLGCGLDSRVHRIDPPDCVRWYDVDFQDVIDLRRKLYPSRPGKYRMVGSPLEDLGWLDGVDTSQPAFVMAEGVTMYLTEDLVKRVLNRVVDHFARGQVAFDAHNAGLVRWMRRRGATVRETGASFSWGIDSPRDAMVLEPRLEFVGYAKTTDMAEYRTLSLWRRVSFWLMDAIPAFRGLHRPLLYCFPAPCAPESRISQMP